MDSMRQYDMEQRDLRLMVGATAMIRQELKISPAMMADPQLVGVCRGFFRNKIGFAALEAEDLSGLVVGVGPFSLSSEEILKCLCLALKYLFGGSNGKCFDQDKFVKTSQMCLPAPNTLELGKYVWPNEYGAHNPKVPQ